MNESIDNLQIGNYFPRHIVPHIKNAWHFTIQAHINQRRLSGEPYFFHPINVAQILLRLGADTNTLNAALLHDVVEDTPFTLINVQMLFGDEIAFLVDGVTKISRNNFRYCSKPIPEIVISGLNQMKLLRYVTLDKHVALIRLADRLHNLITLDAVDPKKQEKFVLETLMFYIPLAKSLGFFELHHEIIILLHKYFSARQLNLKYYQ